MPRVVRDDWPAAVRVRAYLSGHRVPFEKEIYFATQFSFGVHLFATESGVVSHPIKETNAAIRIHIGEMEARNTSPV